MDLKTYLDNAAQVARQSVLAQSDQLTLGELIAKLEPIAAECPDDIEVGYDFEYLFPTEFRSWRGSYRELALNFVSHNNGKKPLTVAEFLKMCQKTVGAKFEGYKGGEYLMGKTTPIWVANWGNSGCTALVEVVYDEYEVVLITGRREF